MTEDIHAMQARCCPGDLGGGIEARGAAADRVVVRGGSWNSRPAQARSAYRLIYRPHERVHDVGFRVICTPASPREAASAP